MNIETFCFNGFIFVSFASLIYTNIHLRKFVDNSYNSLLIITSSYPFTLLKVKYKGYLHYWFYIFQIFDSYISNVVNKNIFVRLLICFNIIWVKKFYIDIIEKVVCSVIYVYIFGFITHFYNTFINKKIIFIHYLCHKIVTNVLVLLDILSNNIKY